MTEKVPNRYQWDFYGRNDNILEDKKRLIGSYIAEMYDKTNKMFVYENLPDSIPAKDLELIIQATGSATFAIAQDELYAFYGGLGGIPNAYYLPTISTVANPYLKFTKVLEIDKDCVVVKNTPLYRSFHDINLKYATLLAEIDISMRFGVINYRIPCLVEADNDNTAISAKEYFKNIVDGKEIGLLVGNPLLKGITTNPYNATNTNSFKDLIELRQYTWATWLNKFGIQSNYNMKRETLNSTEVGIDDDVLSVNLTDLLEERKIGIEKVNKMFGTNIKVKLNDLWDKNYKQAFEPIEEKNTIEENENNQDEVIAKNEDLKDEDN